MSFLTISNPTTGLDEIVPLDEFIPKTRKEKRQETFSWDKELQKKSVINAKRRRK